MSYGEKGQVVPVARDRSKASKKARLGDRIVSGLTDLRDALKNGQKIEQRFTVRTVDLDLQPREYDAEDVRATRIVLGASQALFAQILGVSVETVESWEQGQRTPSPMARRLLDEINRDRDHWLKLLKKAARTTTASK
jgi:putative transcriptional regulator